MLQFHKILVFSRQKLYHGDGVKLVDTFLKVYFLTLCQYSYHLHSTASLMSVRLYNSYICNPYNTFPILKTLQVKSGENTETYYWKTKVIDNPPNTHT